MINHCSKIVLADIRCFDQNIIDKSIRILCDEEKARLNLFAFSEDRKRYAVSHLILRKIVSDETGIGMKSISFGKGSNGKPFLNNKINNIKFNLSHSEYRIAIFINSDGYECGVDIEEPHNRYGSFDDISKKYFSPKDHQQIQNADPKKKSEYFLSFWTQKEALLKAMGVGLSGLTAVSKIESDQPKKDNPSIRRDIVEGDVYCRFSYVLEGGVFLAAACKHPKADFPKIQHFRSRDEINHLMAA